MSIEDVTEIVPEVATISPFQKLVLSIGEIPTNYLESMSYAEQVTWFCMFLQEKVLPVVNQHSEKILEIINYLNNLDLQDEVNNKLDEMAESGELTDIIAQYLQLAGVLAFNTVADMKEATNLVNGSICKTLGYHSIDDNGGTSYKIRNVTNEDVIDEANIIALNNINLVAEIVIKNSITPEMYGCYGDNEHDDTVNFQKAIDKQLKLICKNTYLISNTLNIYSYSDIEFNENSKIMFTGSNACIKGNSIYYAKLDKVYIESNNRTGIGILLEKARNCIINNPHLVNLSTGIKIDGLDMWCASNIIYNPFIYKFNIGIHLTADAGKQTNDTKVIGGYIIDQNRTITDPDTESICVINDASSDTNIFIGVAVENANIGFLNRSPVSSTPMSLIGCRAEAIDSYYLRSTVTCKNLNTIACSFKMDNEKVSVVAPWDQNLDNHRLDNSFIGSKTGTLYYQDYGNSKRQLLGITTDNPKGIKIGPGNGQNQHVIIRGTNSSQVPSNYIIAGGNDGLVFPNNFVMKSTNKYWKIKIDDSGVITTEEYTLQDS